MSAPSTPTTICVFCGSRPGRIPAYVQMGRDTGAAIAARGWGLVYGGGGIGLMGAVADAAAAGGAEVLGIMPQFLADIEKPEADIPHVFVDTMHERKTQMYDAADAFLTLPGGIGTLEECVEILSWAALDLHRKPMIFVGPEGFWDHLKALIAHVSAEGFIRPGLDEKLGFASTPEAALDDIVTRWRRHGRAESASVARM